MNIQNLKQEFLGGWKPFELAWLAAFILAQIWAFTQAEQPSSLLEMVSAISGIICVVFVGKGKISNYFFGLIFAYTYFYVSWSSNFIGEMNTTLYVYIPAQFIGYFLWKENLNKASANQTVIAKALDIKGWVVLLSSIAIGTLLFVQALIAAGGSSTGIDGLTTIITVAAQLLMILRYREQWLLWIVLNILSIVLWQNTPAMYLMYSAYLLNSLYGYWNWRKLQ